MSVSKPAGLALAAFLLSSGAASAARDSILIDITRAFPESMTSTPNGTVISGAIGSIGAGRIFRALPGAETAEPWIGVGSNHMLAPFGVLADANSNTLWVCSNDAPGGSYHPAADQASSALLSFDLKSGKPKGYYPFPDGAQKSLCNDIAIGPDGSAYATDTRNDRLLRLKKGASTLEVWLQKDDLKGGFDGVTFNGPKTLYIGLISASKIMRVSIGDEGKPGEIAELKTDRAIKGPDGIRPAGKNRYIVGQGGELDLMTVNGDSAALVTLKDGLQSAIGGSVSGNTVFIGDGKTQYRINPKMKDQDPGDFRIFVQPLPKP